MIEVVVVQMRKRLSTTWVEKQLALLPEGEQTRLLKYRRWQDQQASLIGRVLSKTKLSELLHVPRESLQINRDEHGRLRLENQPFWEGDFNLSHSNDLIACAVTKSGKIGVDVQYIKPIDLDVAKQFLNSEELQYSERVHRDKLIEFIYQIWTLKEAYLKSNGIGLLRDPRTFGFNMSLWPQNILKVNDEQAVFQEESFFHTHPLSGGYQLAICTSVGRAVKLSTFLGTQKLTIKLLERVRKAPKFE